MQEICQSGSEGGANTYLCPYPYLNGGGPFKPQTALLRRRPSVGVEPWIPLEWEKWSYIPEDWILSNRKSARVYLKRSSENGPFTSSSEELGYDSKRSVFRRTLVRPRRERKRDGLLARRGESLFSQVS